MFIMSLQSFLTVLVSSASILFATSCSNTNQASATTSAAGYHKGKYYLTESEKGLTAEQLQLRIKEEACICADASSSRSKKSAVGTAVKLGVGVATGVGFDGDGKKKSAADMSRARMNAYNDRLVELEKAPLDLSAEVKAAVAERNLPTIPPSGYVKPLS